MPGSLLLAKISLLGLLATFLPLFCGVRRLRLWLFAGMVGFFVLTVASALPVISRSHGGFAGHTTLLAGGGLVALLLLAASTWLAWRHPLWAVPVLLLLMPVRVPVPLGGGSTSNLLMPLYLATLAVAIAEFGIRDRLGLYGWFRRDGTRIALSLFTAVAGVSALWVGMRYAPHTTAFAAALVKLFAFFLPFAVIYYLVYRYVRSERELRLLVGTIVAWGGVLAVIGMAQYATRTVFFNRATVLHEYKVQHVFRVNALFWDPNIYGRFLVVVIILALASALALGGGRLRSEERRVGKECS
jgi:putative inorganic carbon (HCO3(-)) transporter